MIVSIAFSWTVWVTLTNYRNWRRVTGPPGCYQTASSLGTQGFNWCPKRWVGLWNWATKPVGSALTECRNWWELWMHRWWQRICAGTDVPSTPPSPWVKGPIPFPSLFLLRVLLGGGCLGFFCLFVWPNCTAFRILIPQPGIIASPQQLKYRVLTTGPPGTSLPSSFFISFHCTSAFWSSHDHHTPPEVQRGPPRIQYVCSLSCIWLFAML